jgi:hypothetical protein
MKLQLRKSWKGPSHLGWPTHISTVELSDWGSRGQEWAGPRHRRWLRGASHCSGKLLAPPSLDSRSVSEITPPNGSSPPGNTGGRVFPRFLGGGMASNGRLSRALPVALAPLWPNDSSPRLAGSPTDRIIALVNQSHA